MSSDPLDRFRIETLTKEKAAELGHIAWIEEKDPVVAVQKMIAVLEIKPFNCAIWANADENPAWREAVGDWRKTRTFGASSNNRRPDFKSEKESLTALRSAFAKVIKEHPLAQVRRHMRRRLRTLFAAAGEGMTMRFEMRNRCTLQYRDDHIDGSSTRMKTVRFLEVVHGPNTYFFSNKDAIRKPKEIYQAEKPELLDETQLTWSLPDHGRITAYEAPQNSLVALSNETLPWQPILHSEAFLPKNVPEQQRTVLVYNCRYKKYEK